MMGHFGKYRRVSSSAFVDRLFSYIEGLIK